MTPPRSPFEILRILLDHGQWFTSAIELDTNERLPDGRHVDGEALRAEAEESLKGYEPGMSLREGSVKFRIVTETTSIRAVEPLGAPQRIEISTDDGQTWAPLAEHVDAQRAAAEQYIRERDKALRDLSEANAHVARLSASVVAARGRVIQREVVLEDKDAERFRKAFLEEFGDEVVGEAASITERALILLRRQRSRIAEDFRMGLDATRERVARKRQMEAERDKAEIAHRESVETLTEQLKKASAAVSIEREMREAEGAQLAATLREEFGVNPTYAEAAKEAVHVLRMQRERIGRLEKQRQDQIDALAKVLHDDLMWRGEDGLPLPSTSVVSEACRLLRALHFDATRRGSDIDRLDREIRALVGHVVLGHPVDVAIEMLRRSWPPSKGDMEWLK